ncbi:MAG: tetratricopeptide repeat protein, partial [Gemmatimonadaceae bacterium]
AALRMHARLELIGLLAKRGQGRELLAELLPLEDTYKDSVAFRRDLAGYFLRANSPSRALAIYRELSARDRGDVEALAGSGEAYLALGNFRDALRALEQAHHVAPGDKRIAAQLMEADSSRAMNPEERFLGAHLRLVRARALLARTVAVLLRCNAWARSPEDSAQAALVQSRLGATVRPLAEETMGNAIIAQAMALWASRPPTCETGSSPGDRALVHVFVSLAQ